MEEFSFDTDFDENGEDLIDITFHGEKSSCEELLFTTLAPFVKSGSFLEFRGEDGEGWKYVFNDGSMKVKKAKRVYED